MTLECGFELGRSFYRGSRGWKDPRVLIRRCGRSAQHPGACGFAREEERAATREDLEQAKEIAAAASLGSTSGKEWLALRAALDEFEGDPVEEAPREPETDSDVLRSLGIRPG